MALLDGHVVWLRAGPISAYEPKNCDFDMIQWWVISAIAWGGSRAMEYLDFATLHLRS